MKSLTAGNISRIVAANIRQSVPGKASVLRHAEFFHSLLQVFELTTSLETMLG